MGERPVKAELARTWGSDRVPDTDLGRNASLKSLDLQKGPRVVDESLSKQEGTVGLLEGLALGVEKCLRQSKQHL